MTTDAPRRGDGVVAPRLAYLLLGLVILLWGTNWAVMKVGLRGMPPLTFVVTRFGLATACLFVLLAAVRRLRLPSRHDLPIVISVGALQMGAFSALAMVALQHVPAGRSAILSYTTPLWVVPLATIVLHEQVTRWRFAGLILGLAGVAVMFNPTGFDWSDRSVVVGNGLLMIGAVLWAIQIVHVRVHHWHGSPLDLVPWQCAVACAVVLPVALVAEGGRGIHPGPELAGALLYSSAIATAFCFWATVTITRALPAITTSLGMLGVPVVGVFVSAMSLGESIQPGNLVGLVLIAAGLAVVSASDLVSRRDGRTEIAPVIVGDLEV